MAVTDINAPLGWRVYAVADEALLSGMKRQPWFEEFNSKDAADRRKVELQGAGHVATTQPVYATVSKRERVRKKQQWKMPGT